MSDLFGTNQRFKDAIEDINGTFAEKLEKLQLILTRIIQKLDQKHSRSFTEKEELQLQQMLGLSEKVLNSILDSVAFIFEQAAYFALTAEVLRLHLEKIGLKLTIVEAFANVWESESPQLLKKLQNKSIVPLELDEIQWRLHLQMGQNNLQRMKSPSALFELSLKSTSETSQEFYDALKFEFSQEELYDFFEKLETIQEQLDNLSR